MEEWINARTNRAGAHPIIIALKELGDYSKSPFPLPHPVPYAMVIREDGGLLDRPSHVVYSPDIAVDFEKLLMEYAKLDAEYFAFRMMLGAWSTGNYSLDGRIIDNESISFVRNRGPYSVVSTKYKDTFFGYERGGFLNVLRQVAEA